MSTPNLCLKSNLINIFLTWNLIFNRQIDAAHLRARCQNQNGDLGFCVMKDFCKTSNGINIGLCPNREDFFVNEICCYDLPCSRFEEFFNQKSVSRKKRAILHDPTVPIQMTKIDPVCGLRIDNENEEGQRTQPRFEFHVHLVGQNLEREI